MAKQFKIVTAIITLFIATISAELLQAQTKGNSINVSLTHDAVGNLSGGIKTGQAQLGLINLDFSLSTRSMNLWENGTFRIHVQNTYGQKPTESLFGDIQVLSNIENGTYTYLYQFWYQHRLGDFTLLAGKHDLNEVFFTSRLAGEYINSSFGIMPVASLNVPVSIFPRTTLGLVGSYEFDSGTFLKGAIYNGRPGKITHSNFGLDLNLNAENGMFYIAEFEFHGQIGTKPGIYKAGGFHHSGEFPQTPVSQQTRNGSGGLYVIVDQMIVGESFEERHGLGALLQAGYSPSKTGLNDFYVAYGLNYWGLITPKDKLGAALAYASCHNALVGEGNHDYQECETAIELTYKYPFTRHLTVQPDLQYIIHPGMRAAHDNALAGLVRINWSLN
ncbi:MAG: carbohydrate porin [Bacteroidales bacterium]|nr:carbohydrate porin [Bacteroidales bacterium]MCF8333315.1 carbohydrate porin [Bacteroidales bacterium]